MGKSRREIPRYQFPIIESHCHLDMLRDHQIDEALEKSKLSNVTKVVTIAVSKNNQDNVFEIANNYQNVFCSQGIHPHEAKDWNVKIANKIKERASHKKVIAVGEIGLDYHYNYSVREQQINAFEEQFQIAVDHDLPVIIHSREAEEDTISILKNFANSKRKGIIHSFTSKPELAQAAIDNGFYLGFNGIITFKRAEEVRDIVRMTPIERILVETDAPFLTPDPYRGKENAPYYLPFIIEKIAEIKELEVSEVLEKTYQNTLDLFYKL